MQIVNNGNQVVESTEIKFAYIVYATTLCALHTQF